MESASCWKETKGTQMLRRIDIIKGGATRALTQISDVVARFRFTMVIERHNFENKRNH